MADKTLPFSRAKLDEILAAYPTPFHLYDERGMRENARRLKKAFAWAPRLPRVLRGQGVPEPAHHEGDAVRGLRRGLQLARRAAAVAAGGPAGRHGHVHLERHPGAGVPEGARAGRGDQPRRHQPHPVPREARAHPRAGLLPVQSRPAARGQRDHRQARGGEVRVHPGPALRGLPDAARQGREALRPAHDDRVERAERGLPRGDGPDALRPRRRAVEGARDPVRVRQPRRRIRHPVPARAAGHRLRGARRRASARPTRRRYGPAACTRCPSGWRAAGP